MFEMHCITWEVEGFLDGTTLSKGSGDRNWRKLDNLVKMWIYNTISKNLLQMVMTKGETARFLWKALEDLFQSNKDPKIMQLHDDLRTIRIGDLSVSDYCHKLKVIFDTLENLEQPITERELVMHTINGLKGKYDNVATFIRYQQPTPSFLVTRGMLESEETRTYRNRDELNLRDTSSSPTVLYARGNPRNTGPRICRNFQRGYCNYSGKCRFIHGELHHTSSGNSRNQQPQTHGFHQGLNPRFGSGQGAGNGQGSGSGHGYGFGSGHLSTGTPPGLGGAGHTPPGAPLSGFPATTFYGAPHLGPVYYAGPPPGFAYSGPPVQQQALAQQSLCSPLVPMYASSAGSNSGGHPTALNVQSTSTEQPTNLPQAFSNLSFQDNNGQEWYMDTGATSHLTSKAGPSDPKNPPKM